MSLQKLRQNDASFVLLGPHAPAYRAGQYSVRRDQNLNLARVMKGRGVDQFIVSLYAHFARHSHHHYLKCLREIKMEWQASIRVQTYERTVMDRVMGVLHR